MFLLIPIAAVVQCANALPREATVYSATKWHSAYSSPKDVELSLLQTSLNLEMEHHLAALIQSNASASSLSEYSELASLDGKHLSPETYCFIPVPFEFQRAMQILVFLGLAPRRVDGTCDVGELMNR